MQFQPDDIFWVLEIGHSYLILFDQELTQSILIKM